MKGFDYLERRRPKAIEDPGSQAKHVVKGHSKGILNGFFANIVSATGDLLKDDEN
jgi:hypothetical protein